MSKSHVLLAGDDQLLLDGVSLILRSEGLSATAIGWQMLQNPRDDG